MPASREQLLVIVPQAILLCAVFALSTFPLTSYDVWLHLGVGQEIVQRGEVPRVAWGSRHYHDKEWVAHEWGFQASLYLAHDRWGDRGVIFLRAALATLAACALLWALSEAGAGPFAGCGAAGIASFIWFSQLFWPARPQMITQLFLPLLLAILFRGRSGRRRLLLAVPPLFAIWVNLHGGYIIGLAVIVLFLLGELLAGLVGRRADPGWRKALVILLVASGLACLANPYTYHSLIYPFTYYFGEPITAGNLEWDPLVLKRFVLFEALAILTVVSILVARPGPDPLEIILSLAFFHLSVISVRHVPLSAAVLATMLGASWTRWWRAEPLSFPPLVGRVAAAVRRSPWLRGGIVLLVMAVSFGSLWLSRTPPWWLEESRWSKGRPLPVQAVEYIKQEGLTRGLFNQYEWGGYLLYRFPGEDILSIDGRNDVYGAEHNRKYLEAMEGIPTWKATFDEWGVKVVLISRGPRGWGLRFILSEDPDWAPRFQGKSAIVYVRKEGR